MDTVSYYAYYRRGTRLVEIIVTKYNGVTATSETGRTFKTDKDAQNAMIERNCNPH